MLYLCLFAECWNFASFHSWLCVSLAGALSTESLFQRAMPNNLGWMITQPFLQIWRSELLSLEKVVSFCWATFKGQWDLLGQFVSLPMMCPGMTTLLIGETGRMALSHPCVHSRSPLTAALELLRREHQGQRFYFKPSLLEQEYCRSITNPMPKCASFPAGKIQISLCCLIWEIIQLVQFDPFLCANNF